MGLLAADLPHAMAVGDVDVAVHVAFDGFTYSPLSLGTAFFGWNELGGTVEFGALELPDTTLGVGISGWYGAPLLSAAGRRPHVRVGSDGDVDWRTNSAGVAVRTTLHLRSSGLDWPGAMDPYAVATLGPTIATYGMGYSGQPDSWDTHGEMGLRTALGAGGRMISEQGWFVGGELVYAAGFAFQPAPTVLVTRAEGEAAVWVRSNAARVPRGFCWTFSTGWRF